MGESWIDRLELLFLGRNAACSKTATLEDVQRFESKYRVCIPPDWREYFYRLNGTDGGWAMAQGPMAYGFWQLDQIIPLSEEPYAANWPDPEHWFYFADYLIWSHSLAVYWPPVLQERTPVMVDLGADSCLVADDMEAVVAAFERDDFWFLVGGKK